ncbi:MAG: aldo/keto reductase [Planctomycetes bacterium]|nr:aldo/keto reductase [Planctomycetota bacterium]
MLRRRYGRTELQIPVFSTGGMRYQQSWKERIPSQLDQESQKNLENTIYSGLELGFNHIETAQGYGTSEYQLGLALKDVPRESYILQSKIFSEPDLTQKEFREKIEESLELLQTDYLDLFAFHGLNTPEHIDCVIRKGGLMEVAREYQKNGQLRHLGFSTHGSPQTINMAIDSGEFDYVNLWWFYTDQSRTPCLKAAKKQDMGVFIISPTNKGGMLNEAPEKLKEQCAPFSPIVFNDWFCLNQEEICTISVGASKPEDFEEHLKAIPYLKDQQDAELREVKAKLDQTQEQVLGKDFFHRGLHDIPDHNETPGNINIAVCARLWLLAKAFDMTEFGTMRYNLLGNGGHWFPGLIIDDKLLPNVKRLLESHPYQEELMDILYECNELFAGEEQKRLSESD